MKAYKILLFMFVFFNTAHGVVAKDKKEVNEGFVFTNLIEIPTTPVKDQANSGTCWSYATTSFIETEMLRLGHDEVDLSEMFFVYYAYMQKAEKYIRYHGQANFSQGGQGHDVTNVIAEYGMLPEKVYSGINYDSEHHNHDEMEGIMKAILDASLKHKSGMSGKNLLLVNDALDRYLGEIPERFEFNGNEYTPLTFAEQNSIVASDYIEFTSYESYPFYEKVDLEIPDNWSHDDYYNVPISDLLQIIDTAFVLGYSVNWDGDVSEKSFSHKKAVAVLPNDDFKNMEGNERLKWESLTEKERSRVLFSLNEPVLEKVVNDSIRQAAFNSFSTTDDHLMHLIGTAIDQNGTPYYITKNSWADDSNSRGGKLYMSRSYVSLKTVAIQVHKDVIPFALKRKLGIE